MTEKKNKFVSLLSSHNTASLPGNKSASLAFSLPTSLLHREDHPMVNAQPQNAQTISLQTFPEWKHQSSPFPSMKCVCGRVIGCVLYSQLGEGELLHWFEWFCPLCLTVAKAFGCRIKSLMIAHHSGRGKMHYLEFQTDFIQKNWPGCDTEWSLWWPACVFQMGSHTHTTSPAGFVGSTDTSGRMWWSLTGCITIRQLCSSDGDSGNCGELRNSQNILNWWLKC